MLRAMTLKNPLVDIFRAGRHIAMDGREVSFSDADLAKSAAAYDPAKHEAPAVIGHPEGNAPAYGWVKRLSVSNGTLVAQFGDDIDAGFVDIVRAGRFKKVSASFYEPNSANNPCPGTYYLRHVGFLGAQPPAVKGLRPVSFADGDAGLVEFADGPDMGWVLDTVGRLFRSIRDFLIADKGLDEANKVIADWDVGAIEDAATRARIANTEGAVNPAFSEHREEPKVGEKTAEQREAELAAREAALKQREDDAKARDLSFAEAAKKVRTDADVALVDGLVKKGVLVPSARDGVLAFMAGLDHEGTISFGEGDAKKEQSPRDYFRGLISQSGIVVNFAEVSKPDGEVEGVPSDQLAFGELLGTKARAYVAEQAAKGIAVSPEEAVRHVQKEMEPK
jgi:hypothetical protein